MTLKLKLAKRYSPLKSLLALKLRLKADQAGNLSLTLRGENLFL